MVVIVVLARSRRKTKRSKSSTMFSAILETLFSWGLLRSEKGPISRMT
jgi:hypothetical protein